MCRVVISSSCTLKSGSTPASAAYVRTIAWQKAWIVEICARSSEPSAAEITSAFSGSSRISVSRPPRTRSRSSPAARSVKVIAAIWSIGTPLQTSETMRSTSARVLPVPAPASTKSVSPSASLITRRASSSWAR
jgi:hypothetical protein